MLILTPPRRSRESTPLPRRRPAPPVDWAALERRYLTPERLDRALDLLINEVAAQLWPGIALPQRRPRPQRRRTQRPAGRTAAPRG